MSKAPICIDSCVWTGLEGDAVVGDPAISPRERAVFEREPQRPKKRDWDRFLGVGAVIGGGLIWMGLDHAIWSASGGYPYIDNNGSAAPFKITLAVFALTLVLLRVSKRWRFWPVAIMVSMLSGATASTYVYTSDLAVDGPVTTARFAIQKIELRAHSRRLPDRDRFRPEARLIDQRGLSETLYGRKAFIAALAGHDCVTLRIRGGKGHYRFVEAATDLVETPYIDSISGKRNLSRCFTPATKRTA